MYIVAANAPMTGGLLLTIMGNPGLISAINIMMQTFAVPVVADGITRIKHVGGSFRDPAFCLTRMYSMFIMSFGAQILLPVFATMLVDEVSPSCCDLLRA